MRTKAAVFLCAAAATACTQAVYAPQVHAPTYAPVHEEIRNGLLKVHLNSGELVVLSSWLQHDGTLMGEGIRYDVQRRATYEGRHVLPPESIALLETEGRVGSRGSAMVGMVIWTTIWGVTTGACLADPKACFGSCPTFYVPTDSGEVLVAEGFSASIARALEAEDLDALYAARTAGGPFTMRMRNEAWETHAVRGLTLLAVPRPDDGRVLASADGRFYPATRFREPVVCEAAEGDCRAALRTPDGTERSSRADSTDLATPETLELTFPAATGRLGLVLAARQSLMSTYLFYQTMGFFGTKAGEVLAALERGGPEVASRAMGMARIIGRIEVAVWNGEEWAPIGVHDEAGPLATQVEVLPFTHGASGPVRVRLTLTRGAWRLDWAALADLEEPVDAVIAEPTRVLREGVEDSTALALLRQAGTHLVTYPGESYDIVFDLPATTGEWEVFLRSEGYYYEWMRSAWLADENPELAALALLNPARALRTMAPGFARVESEMERIFWSSRFRR
jgi:hypothetical protein